MGLFWFSCLIYSSSRSQDIDSGDILFRLYRPGQGIGAGCSGGIDQGANIVVGYVIGCDKYPGLIDVKDFVSIGIAALITTVIGNVPDLIIGY